VKEIAGKHVVETDKGFATFSFTNDSCYIEDIYVLPQYRKEHVASQLADEITLFAKAKGFNKLLGSVIPTANGSTNSLKILLAYGFKLNSSTANFILMEKAI